MPFLDQARRAPTNYSELRVETTEDHDEPWMFTWPPGTERTMYTGPDGFGASTYLVKFPPGYVRPDFHNVPNPEVFEYHTCHEEIFNLEGKITFGNWYELPEMGYLSHPPRWVHPADQFSDKGCVFLIKISSRGDFIFPEIPENWDGVEFVDGRDARKPAIEEEAKGVSTLKLDDLPWQPVVTTEGQDTGLEGRNVYFNPISGWTTWMATVPAGWTGSALNSAANAETLFVVDGDITVEGTELVKWGYGAVDGSLLTTPSASSKNGATLVCWTRYMDEVATFQD